MINAEPLHDRRLQVVHVDTMLGNAVTEIVSATVDEAGLDARPRHPNGEAARMMVAAKVAWRDLPLAVVRPAKLPTPDHERLIQKTTPLKVGDQRVATLIDILGELLDPARQPTVMIPTRMVKLNEANASLGESSGKQAVGGEGAGRLDIFAVEFERLSRFTRQVHHLGNTGLHPVGHLVLSQPRLDFRIVNFLELFLLKFRQPVKHLSPTRRADTFGVRR